MKTSLSKIFALTMLSVLSVLLCACNDETPEPGPIPSGIARRTILVYGAAFNSLSSSLDDDMLEMQQGYINAGADADSCRLLLYKWNYTASMPALWVLRRTDSKSATWVKLKEYDKSQLSTDPARMAEVIADATALAPARDYGLVLWSHASGWTPARTADKYWFGDDSSLGSNAQGRFMNITDLAEAIPSGLFSFIWADCCHMAGIEVAYELRDRCREFVAYPTEVLANGMPYDKVLPCLLRPEADLNAGAQAFFDYWDSRSGQYRSATISVTRTDRLTSLAAACRALMQGRSAPDASQLQAYHRKETGLGPYYDLLDLCRAYVGGDVADPAYMRVADTMKQTVTYAASTEYFLSIRIDTDRYCGLSTNLYNPTDQTASFYRSYGWYKDVLQ